MFSARAYAQQHCCHALRQATLDRRIFPPLPLPTSMGQPGQAGTAATQNTKHQNMIPLSGEHDFRGLRWTQKNGGIHFFGAPGSVPLIPTRHAVRRPPVPPSLRQLIWGPAEYTEMAGVSSGRRCEIEVRQQWIQASEDCSPVRAVNRQEEWDRKRAPPRSASRKENGVSLAPPTPAAHLSQSLWGKNPHKFSLGIGYVQVFCYGSMLPCVCRLLSRASSQLRICLPAGCIALKVEYCIWAD